MTPLSTLRRIREELAQQFAERNDAIDGALIALLSRHHVLLVGPPGTAKSMLADELCRRIEGARYFQWLLTRFSTPEELFGAVSLKSLEADAYRRVTAGKLPTAHVAFLDEVFKASSSILNAILTVVNERRFHNGTAPESVPLISLFGATNELPEEDELAALYDRFLLRYVVEPIREDFRFLRMLERSPEADERTTLSLEELEALQREAAALPVPSGLLRLVAEARRELAKKAIVASDRRWRQSLDALRAHALLAGRSEVAEIDLAFLEHLLWRDPAERGEIRATLRALVQGHEDEVRELLFQSRELRAYALREWETRELRARAIVEAHTKLKSILARVEDILETARAGSRALTGVEGIRDEIRTIHEEMLAVL
jgi:MoxR-like ATPase